MPMTLYDAEGNPQEVPTAEEIEASKAEFQKKEEEMKAQVETLSKEKEDLEQNSNPNWKAIREVNKKLKDALKTQGKDVDEQGNIIDKKEFNEEEVLGKAKEMFKEENFLSEKERLLSQYSDEDKKTLVLYIDKLMVGEEKNISNLHKFIDQAKNFVFPGQDDRTKQSIYSSNGHGPNLSNDGKPSESTVKMGSVFGIEEKDLNNVDSTIKF